MLKFRGSNKSRDFLGFILEDGNLQRLRQGYPIHILKEEMDLPFDIIIIYTDNMIATEAKMRKDGLVGPETVVHDHRERKKS